jgi:hypothetical protein
VAAGTASTAFAVVYGIVEAFDLLLIGLPPSARRGRRLHWLPVSRDRHWLASGGKGRDARGRGDMVSRLEDDRRRGGSETDRRGWRRAVECLTGVPPLILCRGFLDSFQLIESIGDVFPR